MNYFIKQAYVQDTPIVSFYLEWSEADGEYNCDVPLSWAKRIMANIDGISYYVHCALIDAIKKDDEFSLRIQRMGIDDSEPMPEVFKKASAA